MLTKDGRDLGLMDRVVNATLSCIDMERYGMQQWEEGKEC